MWTTLNVQHLESLNDVLQRITGVQVRETVPDHVFEDADEIVLVDLPTDELLKRLAEGKVYVPDMADRARKRFFKPREPDGAARAGAAPRRRAHRRRPHRPHAGAGDRGAVGRRASASSPASAPTRSRRSIVRAAKRLADVMDAPWIAVTVERPGEQLDASRRRHVDAAMKLARSLGAETTTLAGSDIAAELLRFAKFENVTQIVLGRSRGGFSRELLRRSLPHELVRRADGIAVHVITGCKARSQTAASAPRCRRRPNLALAAVWSGRRWPSPAPSASGRC